MDKPSRPVRNRRHSRRAWPPGDTHRPIKRLFTPEIKRMLKDWLVRRRDNPYPSRDEKKLLAQETGLTYTQICNWFANWRRKLKNSGREPTKKSWGHLIKNYNVNAKGNVEQFSICSDDSIWGEMERCSQESHSPSYSEPNYEQIERRNEYSMAYYNNNHDYLDKNRPYVNDNNYQNAIRETYPDPYYYSQPNSWNVQSQCFQISSTTGENMIADDYDESRYPSGFPNNPKYKHQMMEKYLRDTSHGSSSSSSNPELSKWLESAAKFTPNKNNYIEWTSNRSKEKHRLQTSEDYSNEFPSIHQKEELDAAEALANLACNYRQRLLNSTA